MSMFNFNSFINEKKRPVIMGVLNITPDSFSDGGKYFATDKAVEKARELQNSGADIIDIGACSTSPFSAGTSPEQERERLESALPEIVKAVSVPLSIDTCRLDIAEFALSNGVQIFNDESGQIYQTRLELAKEYGAGYIYMHTGGGDAKSAVKYENGIVAELKDSFSKMSRCAERCGFSLDSLCYDCGIGFGKTREDELLILKKLSELCEFSPILIGVSRKRLIGEATGREKPQDRLFGTLGAEAAAVIGGAKVIRTHDVSASLDAIKTVNAIMEGCFNG